MIARLMVLVGAAFMIGGLAYASPAAASPDSPGGKPCKAYMFAESPQNLCTDLLDHEGDNNCDDVRFKVTVVDVTYDPWDLDSNNDGKGCESWPWFPGSTHKATPTATHSSAEAQTPTLPKTGPGLYVLGVLGGLAVAGGGVALAATRRRRTHFEA